MNLLQQEVHNATEYKELVHFIVTVFHIFISWELLIPSFHTSSVLVQYAMVFTYQRLKF